MYVVFSINSVAKMFLVIVVTSLSTSCFIGKPAQSCSIIKKKQGMLFLFFLLCTKTEISSLKLWNKTFINYTTTLYSEITKQFKIANQHLEDKSFQHSCCHGFLTLEHLVWILKHKSHSRLSYLLLSKARENHTVMFWMTNSKVVNQFQRDFCMESGTEKTMMMRRLLERLKVSTTLRMNRLCKQLLNREVKQYLQKHSH